MSIWFSADCHFNHKNIIEYCNRPYASVKEMNKALIDNWNSVVAPEDTVWVIGDMFMGSWKNISEIVPQLNGDIYLVIGNHDSKHRQEEMAKAGIHIYEAQIAGFHHVQEVIPMAIHNFGEIEDKSYETVREAIRNNPVDPVDIEGKDVIWLYGHIHDNAPAGIQKEEHGVYSFHVGVDTNNYTPVSWDYIVEQYKKLKDEECKDNHVS